MRLCHRAGHAVPLLTISAVLAGCATSTTAQPPNFNNPPQVVAIYAVDSALGVLPDVLIFSSDPADSSKISPNPPPSYGGIRVEFDQPVSGPTIANNADRATTIGGAASFCSPLGITATAPNGNPPISIVDVTGDATRGPGPIISSICYDATSPLGQHPHVLIIPGDNSIGSATPATNPLTCNQFAPDPGEQDGGNVFKPNHKYGVKVQPNVVANGAGKQLSAPTSAGWNAGTFEFTTSGLKIMAAGFQDANTGFFVWLDKPEPGFEKDLAPCAITRTCPDVNDNNVLGTFEKPADSSPFLVVLSEAVSDTAGVTLTRDDATNPASAATTGGGLIGDARVIEVNTGDTFEPGQAYKLTIPGTLKADSGDVIAAGKTYTFSAAPGTPAVLSTTPANGAQAQAVGTAPQIEFSAPVAPATPGTPTTPTSPPFTPAGTFTLTGPGGAAVPLAATGGVLADPAANSQIVTLTPAAPLAPETTYTITASGVKVGAEPKALAGQTFPNKTSQFTTASFRMTRIAATATSNTNIDRATNVAPATLKNGGLTITFNSVPVASTVNTTTVKLSELNGIANTPTALSGYTVTQSGADPARFSIAMPASYQPKYGQKYEVKTTTGVIDSVSNKPLSAEGCTVSATTPDCSDVKSFTTRKVTATVRPDQTPPPAPNTPPAPTGFKVTFSDPIDPASITPFLGTEFKLFERVNGALNTTPVPITCQITSAAGANTVVTCTATGGLGVSPRQFLASAVFLQTATPGQGGPAIVDPSVSTDQSARFFGSVSANVFARCGP